MIVVDQTIDQSWSDDCCCLRGVGLDNGFNLINQTGPSAKTQNQRLPILTDWLGLNPPHFAAPFSLSEKIFEHKQHYLP